MRSLVLEKIYKAEDIDDFANQFDVKALSNKDLYKNLYLRHTTNKFLLCYKNSHNENKRISLCRGIFLPIEFKDKIRISSRSTSRIDKIQYETVLGDFIKKV